MIKTKYLPIFVALMMSYSLSGLAQKIEEQADHYLEYTDSADQCMKNSRWERAEEYLLMALREHPADLNNSLLLNNLGSARQHQGKLSLALEAYDLGLSLTPNSLVLLKNRASALVEADSLGAACRDVDHALSIEPNDRWSRKTHGLICLSLKRTEEAISDFHILLKDDPEAEDLLRGIISAYIAKESPSEAEKYSAILVDRHPNADNWYLRGLTLLLAEKYSEADEAVRSGLELDNRNGDLYMLKACLSHKRYRYEEAKIEKKMAIEFGADPELVEMLVP